MTIKYSPGESKRIAAEIEKQANAEAQIREKRSYAKSAMRGMIAEIMSSLASFNFLNDRIVTLIDEVIKHIDLDASEICRSYGITYSIIDTSYEVIDDLDFLPKGQDLKSPKNQLPRDHFIWTKHWSYACIALKRTLGKTWKTFSRNEQKNILRELRLTIEKMENEK